MESMALFALSKAELQAVVVLALVIVALSLFNVALAWGGVLLSMVGFVLLKDRTDTGEASGEVKPTVAGTREGRVSIRGTLPLFMIVGGLLLAVVDIWRNGGGTVREAKANTQDLAVAGRLSQADDHAKAMAVFKDYRVKQAHRDHLVGITLPATVRMIQDMAKKGAADNQSKPQELLYTKVDAAVGRVNSAATAKECVTDITEAVRQYQKSVNKMNQEDKEGAEPAVLFARFSGQQILLLELELKKSDAAFTEAEKALGDHVDVSELNRSYAGPAIALLIVAILILLLFGGAAVATIAGFLQSRRAAQRGPAPESASKTAK